MARHPEIVKFRQPVAVPIAAAVALFGSAAAVAQVWWTTPIMLIPLALLIYGLRTGVDVSPSGIRVRSAVTTRSFAWSEVAGFITDRRRVSLKLTDGRLVRFPAVQSADLPRLLAAGKQDLAAS
ncbi:hypothetical protein GCM10009765_35950 [Fodinicola feengrottensis]|uniref:Low molecular weight protein antigen 6 PH domain-containing protein n=1 Tax=Fodinicola feengrottensis TaxID=435914 RepID=A0ABN2H899_9ACTN